jgi:hypothetical protein
MAARHRCRDALGHLQPSQGALTSAAGASGARMPPALDSSLVLSPPTLQMYVLIIQMFQRYFAKVDRDIAYVAMTIHVCCKSLF